MVLLSLCVGMSIYERAAKVARNNPRAAFDIVLGKESPQDAAEVAERDPKTAFEMVILAADYKEYVERKKREGEKPLDRDAWEARVEGGGGSEGKSENKDEDEDEDWAAEEKRQKEVAEKADKKVKSVRPHREELKRTMGKLLGQPGNHAVGKDLTDVRNSLDNLYDGLPDKHPAKKKLEGLKGKLRDQTGTSTISEVKPIVNEVKKIVEGEHFLHPHYFID